MFLAKIDGMEFRSKGIDFGDAGPYELFLNILVERAMERYDVSCGDPHHFTASWINKQELGVEFEATNEIVDEIPDYSRPSKKLAMSPEAKSIQVGGYTKKDGTVVKPYTRDGDKKADESSPSGSSLSEDSRPSVLHYKREGETDLDLLGRVFDRASGKIGEEAAEEIYNDLAKEGIKDDGDVAAYLQLHVLSEHGRGKRIPEANQFLKKLLDFNPEYWADDIAGKVGGYGNLLEIASKVPPVAEYSYATMLADKHGISRRDIEDVLRLSAFLRHSSSGGLSLRKDILGLMLDREYPDGTPMSNSQLAEAIAGVSKIYKSVGLGGSARESISDSFSDIVSSGRMSFEDAYGLLDYITSDYADTEGMLKDLARKVTEKHPALYHDDIDPEEAYSDLKELSDSLANPRSSFASFVEVRLERWEEILRKQDRERRAAEHREMVLANANVTREQQAANDAALKSQYAEAEPSIQRIVSELESRPLEANLSTAHGVEKSLELMKFVPMGILLGESQDAIQQNAGKQREEFLDAWRENIRAAVDGGELDDHEGESMLASIDKMSSDGSYLADALIRQSRTAYLKSMNVLSFTVKKYIENGYPDELNLTWDQIRNTGMEYDDIYHAVSYLAEDLETKGEDRFNERVREVAKGGLAQSLIWSIVDRSQVVPGFGEKSVNPFFVAPLFDPSELQLFAGSIQDKGYSDAQIIAKEIQSKRQQEIFKERLEAGLLDEQTSNRAEDNELKLNDKIASEVWSGWKSSSTTDIGKAMQLAAVDEFGVLGKPEYEVDRNEIIAAVGKDNYDLIKIHLRATWEATQYLLKATGKDSVTMWRGLQLPASELGLSDEMKAAPRLKKFKLDNLKLLRNGLSSATTDPRVANSWGGVGELPKDARRVVIRIDAGAEDILSLPVFGDNIHSEQEVLPMGSRWNRWDAWLNFAPDSPDSDWTPEPNESKSMISEIDGERIIEFEGGGGWLEEYRESTEELEVIGDEAYELAEEEENEEIASVLKSLAASIFDFTERKGWVKPYTKQDGTKVEGYWSKKDKKQEDIGSAKRQKSTLEDWLKLAGSKEEHIRSNVEMMQREDTREAYEFSGTPIPSDEEVAASAGKEYDETVEKLKDINAKLEAFEGYDKGDIQIEKVKPDEHGTAASLRLKYNELGRELRDLSIKPELSESDLQRKSQIETQMSEAMVLIEDYHAAYTEFSIDSFEAEKQGDSGRSEYLEETKKDLRKFGHSSVEDRYNELKEQLEYDLWNEFSDLDLKDPLVHEDHDEITVRLAGFISEAAGVDMKTAYDAIDYLEDDSRSTLDMERKMEHASTGGDDRDEPWEKELFPVIEKAINTKGFYSIFSELEELYNNPTGSGSYRLMLESSLDGLIDQAYEEASDGVDVSSGSIAADENVRGAFKADIVRKVSRMLETSAEDEALTQEVLYPGSTGNIVQSVLDTWAESSSNSTLGSIALQEAIRLKFGDSMGIDKVHGDPDTIERAREALSNPVVAKVMDEVVTRIYEHTQATLPEGNYSVYRGMAWNAETVPPEIRLAFENQLFDKTYPVDKQGNLSTSGEGDGRAVIVNTPPEQNPLSSYSFDYDTSRGFTGSTGLGWRGAGRYRAILLAIIPKDRIFSTYGTGPGCLNEAEVVVLGGDPPASRMLIAKDGTLPYSEDRLLRSLDV